MTHPSALNARGDCNPLISVVKHADSGVETPVPSLIRFLLVIAILVGLVWGAMVALVSFVEPQPREMIQTIPPNRLNR